MSSGYLQADIIDQFRNAFEGNCLKLLVAGYYKLLDSKIIDLSWEEEKITMELARCMKECDDRRFWKIHVVAEPRLYSEEISLSGALPK
ncbi:MAG TPA: hypothetical protein VFE57_01395, partial [Cyclobacteriaceae bacterium]|nr:hypothetical protein [Cyclobacteriaceae bacterium]